MNVLRQGYATRVLAPNRAASQKREIQPELDLARRICGGNGAEGGAIAVLIQHPEVGVIQQIETFTAKLQIHAFGDAEVLDCASPGGRNTLRPRLPNGALAGGVVKT